MDFKKSVLLNDTDKLIQSKIVVIETEQCFFRVNSKITAAFI